MHIVIVINTSWNIYNFRRGLILRFLKNGWKVTAVAPRDEYSDKLLEIGCHYHEITMDSSSVNPVKDISLYFKFVDVFTSLKPDCLLLYTIKPNIYGSLAARKLNIPVINNISGLGTAFLTSNWLSWFVKSLYRFALSNSQTVFFQNKDDEEFFVRAKLVRPKLVQLIPGSGVDTKYFKPSTRIGEKNFTFILVARLLVEKGITEYIEAAVSVKKTNPDIRVLLVGEYPLGHPRAIDRKWLDEHIELGTVEYHNRMEDIRSLLREADVVVLPSYREGLSKTLLEGAAMGKPIIAANVPGCREVVLNERNGYLCEPYSSRSLEQVMLKMIHTPKDKLEEYGVQSRKLAEEHFDEEIVITHYLKAIHESNKHTL